MPLEERTKSKLLDVAEDIVDQVVDSEGRAIALVNQAADYLLEVVRDRIDIRNELKKSKKALPPR